MLSKQSEQFLTKLRVELLFRGKKEQEVNEIDDELRDHLTIAEENGEDVSDITNTPIAEYADHFAQQLNITQGIYKYIMYLFVFLFVLIIVPRMFDESFTISVSLLLYVGFIIIIGGVLQLYVWKKTIIRYGDQKITYILLISLGIAIFGLIILGEFLRRKYPIYNIITLNQTQSVIIGLCILIAVSIGCIIIKQKLFAVILFVICLPNLIGLVFSLSGSSKDTVILISTGVLIIINLSLTAYFIYNMWKERKSEKENSYNQ